MADQKFQLRYSATEDRVLIISGSGPEDMRCFALTRRMVGQLWPGMNRIIASIAPRTRLLPAESATATTPGPAAAPQDRTAPAGATPSRTTTAGAPAAAARPTAPARPDTPGENPFGTPPQDAHHLVRKLQLVDQGGGARLLVLAGEDVELRVPLDSMQLLQIYDALRLVIERAEWGIDLDAGLPDAGAAAPATQDVPAPTIDISAESPSRYRH